MTGDGNDAGAATVTMITLCFVFLAGSLLWLSRTVDQSLSDRTHAAAIAFQAARAGAQQIDPAAARRGVISVDPQPARAAAVATVTRLLAVNGDTGTVDSVSIDAQRVVVTVTITTTGRPATGTASAVAVAAVASP
jgi:hypothetical protein